MKQFMEGDHAVVRICLACEVPQGKGALTHRERAANGLVFYTKGAERYEFLQGNALDVRAGEVLYLPKGCSYSVFGEGECFAINFEALQLPAAAPFVYTPKNTAELQGVFAAAARLWSQKERGYQMQCREQLYRIFNLLQREYRTTYAEKSKEKLITPAVFLIHERYRDSTPTVAELAAACGITPEYFRAIFRKCYGRSPLDYINHLRVTNARELIESGEYGVLEAATLCGFSDPSHFSRTFKRYFGFPPVECKK